MSFRRLQLIVKVAVQGLVQGYVQLAVQMHVLEVVNIHAIRCAGMLVLVAWELVSLVAKLQQ